MELASLKKYKTCSSSKLIFWFSLHYVINKPISLGGLHFQNQIAILQSCPYRAASDSDPRTGLEVGCTQLIIPEAVGWCCASSHTPAASHGEVSALPHWVGSGISDLSGLAVSKQGSWAQEVACFARRRPPESWENIPSCATLKYPGVEVEISPMTITSRRWVQLSLYDLANSSLFVTMVLTT